MKRVAYLAGILLAGTVWGSVPDLAVDYRSLIRTNEMLTLTVRRLASTSAVPVRVRCEWRDERGRCAVRFEDAQSVPTGVGERVVFERSFDGTQRAHFLTPRLTVVSEDGTREVFAHGLYPIAVQETGEAEGEMVSHALPKVLSRPLLFSATAVPGTKDVALQVSWTGENDIETVEIFENSKILVVLTGKEAQQTYRYRPSSDAVILRARVRDAAGRLAYASALQIPRLR